MWPVVIQNQNYLITSNNEMGCTLKNARQIVDVGWRSKHVSSRVGFSFMLCINDEKWDWNKSPSVVIFYLWVKESKARLQACILFLNHY